MLTAETKTSSTASNQIQTKRKPFFNKEGQGDFFSKSNEIAQPFFSPNTIQPKLTIGQPNDKYEVEADAMADKVVQRLSESSNKNVSSGTASPTIQRKCSTCEEEEKVQKKEDDELLQNKLEIQRKPIFESNAEQPEADVQTKPISDPLIQAKCSSCEEEEKLQKKEEKELPDSELSLQRKSDDTPSENSTDFESRLSSSKGGGSSLPEDLQTSMGSAFGADFSGVRVHTGSQAVQMSQDIGAQAFTHGSDIYFNQDKYDTTSSSGNQLLAHELTHTVQQGGSNVIQKNQDDNYSSIQDSNAPKNTLIQRSDPPETASETKDEFVERVFTKAILRLRQNILKLNAWKSYVLGMEGFQLQAQLLSGTANEYMLNASQTIGGPEDFETWAGTHNSAERDFVETNRLAEDAPYRSRANSYMDFISSKTHGYYETPSVSDNLLELQDQIGEQDFNEIRFIQPDSRYIHYAPVIERFRSGESGGCQTCHDIQFARRLTIRDYGDPMPSGQRFPSMFGDPPGVDSTSNNPINSASQNLRDEQAGGGQMNQEDVEAIVEFIDSLNAANGVAGTDDTSLTSTGSTSPWQPEMSAPESLDIPALRTNLCGELQDESENIPPIDPSQWGPYSAIVLDAVQNIGTALEPLGPNGYRVIPFRTFNQLWQSGPNGMDTVRSEIIQNINKRQQQYRKLISEIQIGNVPYEELCPIVDELLPTTNGVVKTLVGFEIRLNQFTESILDVIIGITGAAMLLLAFIFPPSILLSAPLLATGAALSLASIATGVRDRRRGRQYGSGQGAGVYTPAQESQAESLELWGTINIVMGVVDLINISRASALMRARTNATQGTHLLSPRTQLARAGWQMERVSDDFIRLTHADLPGEVMVTRTSLRYQTPDGTRMRVEFEIPLRPPGTAANSTTRQSVDDLNDLVPTRVSGDEPQLTRQQLQNEFDEMTRRRPRRSIDREIDGRRYIEEVEINGHHWRKQENGRWCRFSVKRCLTDEEMDFLGLSITERRSARLSPDTEFVEPPILREETLNNGQNINIYEPTGNIEFDAYLMQNGYVMDISDMPLNVTAQFPTRSLDPDFIPPQVRTSGNRMVPNVAGETNAQLAARGRNPYLSNGEPIELHHSRQNFFALEEQSVGFHRGTLDDLDAHPMFDDPAYISWRRTHVWFEGRLRTLGEIYDILRPRYWKTRF